MVSNGCSEAVAARLEGLGGEELLALAGEAVRRASGRPLDGLEDDALVASVGGWHRAECAVQAEKLRRVAAVEQRRAWRGQAYNGVNLWTGRLGVSRAEAKTLVESAVALQRMPRAAARLAGGKLGPGHVADAARTMTQLERLATEDAGGSAADVCEKTHEAAAALDGLLAEEADRHDASARGGADGTREDGGDSTSGTGGRVVPREALRQRLRDFQHERAPDLLAEREQRLRARRSLRLGRDQQDPDQAPWLGGRLAPVTFAKARSVLHAMARQHDQGDTRTFDQRCHDAFDRVLDIAIASGLLPDTGGEQPRVLLTVDADTLHDLPHAAPATLDGYGPVSNGTARQLCCDAEVTVVATTDGGKTLNVGRDRRKPNRRQRRAAFTRDKGCIGCGAALASCQIHHIVYWSDGGPTDIDNLVAICWDCHARIHHYGWRVIRTGPVAFRLVPPDDRAATGKRLAS